MFACRISSCTTFTSSPFPLRSVAYVCRNVCQPKWPTIPISFGRKQRQGRAGKREEGATGEIREARREKRAAGREGCQPGREKCAGTARPTNQVGTEGRTRRPRPYSRRPLQSQFWTRSQISCHRSQLPRSPLPIRRLLVRVRVCLAEQLALHARRLCCRDRRGVLLVQRELSGREPDAQPHAVASHSATNHRCGPLPARAFLNRRE